MMTIKIAIVDDIYEDKRIVKEYLNSYLKTKKVNFIIDEFSSGEAFLGKYTSNRYNIVFMDIFMGKINGFDTASKLYENDPACKIIFLTSSTDYAQLSYSVHAVYYLLKPLKNKDFLQAMDFCNIFPKYDVEEIEVTSNRNHIKLNTLNIMYVEHTNRKTTIYFTPDSQVNDSGYITVSETFSKIAEQLQNDTRFLLCIRGIIINMDFVIRQEGTSFYLADETKIPINIRKQSSIIKAYRNYIFDGIRREI